MNELALIFDRLDIDTRSVLEAAGTKWNFLDFSPGLVGGHCIGVDPYYLTHLAEKVDYIPQVILAGRRINDSMGRFVAQRAIKEMVRAGHELVGSTVTVLGLTFKDDCPDLRNSKAIDIVRELEDYNIDVQVHDPMADPAQVLSECNIKLVAIDDLRPADMVIVAVAHSDYRAMSFDQLLSLMGDNPVLIDVRAVFDPVGASNAGITLWRL
jgi:UDP-N-acetyl-D-galactosamine dehydrogenase